MDFRWKNRGGNLPNVQPNFVDPQNTQATAANPQAPFQPGGPSQSPQDFLTGVTNQADRNEKIAKLGELKEKLVAIDAEIAKVKASPMSRENEMAVASKLAEIGDTSAYQAILARQQNQDAQKKSNAASIDNKLYDAEKVLRGLTAAETEEQRAMYRSTLEGTLREAEEVGAKLGIDATQHPSYKRIAAELAGASDSAGVTGGIGDMTDRLNKWQAKITDETFSDADRAEVEKLRNDKTNSQFFKQLDDILAKTKGKTKEDRDRGKAYAAKIDRGITAHLNSSPEDQEKWLSTLSPKDLEATKARIVWKIGPDGKYYFVRKR